MRDDFVAVAGEDASQIPESVARQPQTDDHCALTREGNLRLVRFLFRPTAPRSGPLFAGGEFTIRLVLTTSAVRRVRPAYRSSRRAASLCEIHTRTKSSGR